MGSSEWCSLLAHCYLIFCLALAIISVNILSFRYFFAGRVLIVSIFTFVIPASVALVELFIASLAALFPIAIFIFVRCPLFIFSLSHTFLFELPLIFASFFVIQPVAISILTSDSEVQDLVSFQVHSK